MEDSKKWMDTRNQKPLEHHHVFYSRTHRKLTPSSFYNILKNVSKKLRISIYPHKLRRTYAVNLWKMDVPLHIILERLGHTSARALRSQCDCEQKEICRIYTEDLREDARRMRIYREVKHFIEPCPLKEQTPGADCFGGVSPPSPN